MCGLLGVPIFIYIIVILFFIANISRKTHNKNIKPISHGSLSNS